MNKDFDVVVVGELNVDLIYHQVEKVPEIGKEVVANDMTITVGSSSAIFASSLSTLGSRVAFVGKLGYDAFGDYIICRLKSLGVDIDHIERCAYHHTGVTTVFNSKGAHAMITYPGVMKCLNLMDIPYGVLLSSRHLHLSSLFLQTGLIKDINCLFKHAKELGLTTSLDPQWDPAECWNIDLKLLLPYVDIFLPNMNELLAMTRAQDMQSAIDSIKSMANILVVKNGVHGAYAWDGENIIYQPAFINNQVIDSVGAGDNFNSGFIHKFLQGESLAECLEFGALAGAINTTHAGGINAFEDLNLVKSIAASAFNYTFK